MELALLVAGDRRDLVGLDDQICFQALDGLSRLFRGRLVRIGNRNECCHGPSLLGVTQAPRQDRDGLASQRRPDGMNAPEGASRTLKGRTTCG
jgi:hypothetical protein